MDVITPEAAASYLELPGLTGRLRAVVGLVNSLIVEKWRHPADPVPTSVQLLAYDMVARAMRVVPTDRPVESVTVSVDDGSRTERYVVDADTAGGVYISDDELAALNRSLSSDGGAFTVLPGSRRRRYFDAHFSNCPYDWFDC